MDIPKLAQEDAEGISTLGEEDIDIPKLPEDKDSQELADEDIENKQ